MFSASFNFCSICLYNILCCTRRTDNFSFIRVLYDLSFSISCCNCSMRCFCLKFSHCNLNISSRIEFLPSADFSIWSFSATSNNFLLRSTSDKIASHCPCNSAFSLILIFAFSSSFSSLCTSYNFSILPVFCIICSLMVDTLF